LLEVAAEGMTGPEILKIAGKAGVERIAQAVEQTGARKKQRDHLGKCRAKLLLMWNFNYL